MDKIKQNSFVLGLSLKFDDTDSGLIWLSS